MQLRQLKLKTQVRMLHGLFAGLMIPQYLDRRQADAKMHRELALVALIEPDPQPEVAQVEPAKYVVARKKDGAIVGSYDTMDEAWEVIEKARKGKKAALEWVGPDLPCKGFEEI